MVQLPDNYYRLSSSSNPPLQIGIILGSQNELPAFAARIVEDIRSSNFSQIRLLIKTQSTVQSLTRQPSKLYGLYLRLDERMRPANDPLSMVDASELLSGVETIEEGFAQQKGQSFSSETLERIGMANLDVLIDFGSQHLEGNILRASRFGVWSFHHGDPEFYLGEPNGFWELRENSSLSGAALQVLNDPPSEHLVLAKNLFATERTLSVSRNRYIPYWGSTDLVIRKLNELHRWGWDYVREKALTPTSYKGKRHNSEAPGNLDMVRWLGPILLKKAARFPFRKKIVPHWRIAIRSGAQPLFEAESDLEGFRWIEPPPGHCWADPFVFEHDGKFWAFFEDYSYEKMRAAIACAEILPQGQLSEPITCLEHATDHYSYPYIFRARSEIYMIPESYDSDAVDLYRCERFPDRWTREARLFEGKFVDTTVWEQEGLWWLLTTSAAPVPGAGSLLLFYSESITGPWNFHPENPISTDIRVNRGAGRVFRSGQHLIRPSQSGAPIYGYSITFHQITELSTRHYAEQAFKTITPHKWKGVAGVHTYNRAGEFEFIDGQTPTPLSKVRRPR